MATTIPTITTTPMGGRKDLLARVIGAMGLPAVLQNFSVGGADVPILAYHRVLDLPADADSYPFNPELVSASVAGFATQMRYLKQHLTPITFAQLQAAISGIEPLPPRAVIVTFDDGFDDNYHFAFPILRELQIPATFFIATGYVGSGESFWFERLYGLFVASAPQVISLDVLAKRVTLGATAALRRQQAISLLQMVKHLSNADRLSMLEQIETQLAPTANLERHQALSRALSWQQIGEMAAAGMEFGSHSVTHPVLTQISDQDLAWELVWSRRTLEQHIGRKCTAFCYPMGLADTRMEAAAEEAGYDFAAGYLPGVNSYGNLERFLLRRLHVERYTSAPYFEAMLAIPSLFMNY